MRNFAMIALAATALAAIPAKHALAQDTPGPAAVVATSEHRSLAIKHTQAAIDAGKDGSAAGVADHAKQALTHVEAARKDEPGDEKLAAAVKSLENAMAKGRGGDREGAWKSADEALEKLQAKS